MGQFSDQEILNELSRAEDILLGALGFDTDARLLRVERWGRGYRGRGRWSDGEEFDFESEEELTELEAWAVAVLAKEKRQAA